MDDDEIRDDERLEISDPERERILEIVAFEEADGSPRLLKRFINTYLIASRLVILRARKNMPAYEGREGPTNPFIDWMFLSTVFPYESSLLLKWFVDTDWKKEPDDSVFLNDLNVSVPSGDDSATTDRPSSTRDRMACFAGLFGKLSIKAEGLEYYKEIISCFCPYLD